MIMPYLDGYISLTYAATPIVIAIGAASCVLCALLFVYYLRRSRYKKEKSVSFSSVIAGKEGGSNGRHAGSSPRGSKLEGIVTPQHLNNSDDGGSINNLAAGLLRGSQTPQATATNTPSARASQQPKRPRREASAVTLEDWGQAVVAYGIDLGSFGMKGHCYKDGKMTELPSRRSVVSVVEEGIVLGDVEVALEHPETSFFSLTRDLAAPDSVACVNDVMVHPYQALAGAIMHMLGDRAEMPPVGVCVPPYLQHVAQSLYLAANAASAQRFLIYSHSAACNASLLRLRQQNNKRQVHKPPRNVVIVDFGRSGVAAYVSEVRDSAASVRFQTFRSAGIQNMESRMVLELSSGLDERDESLMGRIIEAAKDVKEDFANVPEYLAATKRVSSVHLGGSANVTVELSRERFDDLCKLALQDLDETANDIVQWVAQNLPNSSLEDLELHLIGNGFRYKAFRNVFESKFDRRNTHIDKISVSQGLAQLMVMEHPLFEGQRFDIYPLFQLPTVDELGVRRFEEVTAKRFSIMSPRATRHSSQLARERTRSDSSSAHNLGSNYGST